MQCHAVDAWRMCCGPRIHSTAHCGGRVVAWWACLNDAEHQNESLNTRAPKTTHTHTHTHTHGTSWWTCCVVGVSTRVRPRVLRCGPRIHSTAHRGGRVVWWACRRGRVNTRAPKSVADAALPVAHPHSHPHIAICDVLCFQVGRFSAAKDSLLSGRSSGRSCSLALRRMTQGGGHSRLHC
jgi:hypothetical protein